LDLLPVDEKSVVAPRLPDSSHVKNGMRKTWHDGHVVRREAIVQVDANPSISNFQILIALTIAIRLNKASNRNRNGLFLL